MPEDKKIAVLTSRLKRLGGYILGRRLLFGLLMILSLIFAASFIAAVSHWLFYLPVWFRMAFVVVFMIAAAAGLFWYIFRPIIRRPSNQELALMVEKANPDIKNRFIASLQLEKNLLTNRENYSPALIRQCISEAEEVTSKIEFNRSYRSSNLKRGLRYVAVTAVLTMAVWLLSPSVFNSSLKVFANPSTEIPRQITYNLAVMPENADVLKFDNLEVNAAVFGSRLPSEGKIFWKIADDWRSAELEENPDVVDLPEISQDSVITISDTSVFKYEFKDIRHDFQYYVQSGHRKSDIYQVKVVDKPRINNIRLTYFYPEYTGLAPTVIDENDGTIQALRGTRVKIEAELNKPVEDGRIVIADSTESDLEIEGNMLTTTLSVDQETSYHLEVTDNIGHMNPNPIEYKVYVLEDNFPQISIVRPGANVDLNDYLALDLAATLSDDFGFSRLVLHYRVTMSPTQIVQDSTIFNFDRKKTSQVIEYYWDMSNLGLFPGSFVDYYFEVFDNDNISGPKSSTSKTYTARHPTIEEMFVDIEEAREDMIEDMIETYRQQQRLDERMRELHEDLMFQDDMEWLTQKDIEKTATDQQKLLDDLEKMSEEFKRVNEDAKKNDMLTLEMIQKLNELQKLFDEIATPEMKEAMKKMQEALEKMDKNELEKAMEEYEMTTEEMIQNIERSLAQLKRFQVEQKMQAMVAMAEEILKNQNKVNEQTESSNASELPNLKSREDRNTEDLKNLKDEARELRDLLKENQLDSDQNSEQFCNAVENTDADQDMQQMSQSLQNQQKEQARQYGEISSDKLDQMLSKMKDAQAQFNNTMSAEMVEKMRNAVDDILYLSDEQEKLYQEIQPLDPRSDMIPQYAQKQQDLKAEAERLRTNLQEIAKQSVFVQNALDEYMKNVGQCMSNAMDALSGKNGRSAMGHQSEGIYSLNQSAQTLIQSLNSESQCNSSCSNNQSMFNKMKKLSKGQNKINKQTSNMCDNPSNNPGKPSQEAMRRLAAQQQKIRDGVGEMVDQFGDRKDVAGRLDKLGEEMKKVIEALKNGEVGEGTLDRQKNIYSRMLDFQLSLERRDYSEQRRADTGEDMVRKSPAELELEKRLQESAYRAKLEKFMEESYPPEYESLIKDYYKALMQNRQQ